jgi:hypothetical protein
MIIETEIEVENTLTEECAFAPCFINVKHIAFARPHINDEGKYSGKTSVEMMNGSGIIIKMPYKELLPLVDVINRVNK